MIYAITYKDFKVRRQVLFDRGQAQVFEGAELVNEKLMQTQDRLADLLDGSPKRVKVALFKKEIQRTDYPREKIAFWRQCLQTLEIVPYQFNFEVKK